MVVLDTADPAGLAAFYGAVLGWPQSRQEEDWCEIAGPAGQRYAFQLAPDHRPPTWPDEAVPQQFHLDLHVDDMDAAGAFVVSLGARHLSGRGQPGDFEVYLDPSGHPFCLCT
ncbi:MAG: Glyoxalase/bleomycin resistance protein/dioxygenase [Friedmanniella sp.]|nr:Glyoxalase/bleomycin resistance protein/dioxygenase [Friedmanniella sp.]